MARRDQATTSNELTLSNYAQYVRVHDNSYYIKAISFRSNNFERQIAYLVAGCIWVIAEVHVEDYLQYLWV